MANSSKGEDAKPRVYVPRGIGRPGCRIGLRATSVLSRYVPRPPGRGSAMYIAQGGQARWATGHESPRIMFYCDDEAQGFGHLRRTLTVAQFLASYWPSLRQLIVTG